MGKSRKSDIEAFLSLSDSQKERIVREVEAETPRQRLARSRPLTASERRQWKRFKDKSPRRPRGKKSEASQTISLIVEKRLLRQADAYAKRHGISRAELVARGLQTVLKSAAA
jgi:hypothetical protein